MHFRIQLHRFSVENLVAPSRAKPHSQTIAATVDVITYSYCPNYNRVDPISEPLILRFNPIFRISNKCNRTGLFMKWVHVPSGPFIYYKADVTVKFLGL